MTVPLFPSCVLPGCSNPVADPTQPCPDCVAAFGPMLRPGAGRPITAADIEDRDQAVAAVLAARRAGTTSSPAAGASPERPRPLGARRNQRCWACEERRTCTPDPAMPGRWICARCQQL